MEVLPEISTQNSKNEMEERTLSMEPPFWLTSISTLMIGSAHVRMRRRRAMATVRMPIFCLMEEGEEDIYRFFKMENKGNFSIHTKNKTKG